MKHRINITYDIFTLHQPLVTATIKRCITSALEAEGVQIPCELNVLITNDQGIHAINKASRNIDKATDVLSFPMFQLVAGIPPADWVDYMDPESDRCPLGDMAISYERAVKQAEEYGHSVRREIGYLTIHSMLHLLGYDHLDEGPQKKQMRQEEERIAATISGLQRG